MSTVDELRKRLLFLAAFSGMTGLYLAGSAISSFYWISRVLSLLAGAGMAFFGLLEYWEIIELYQEQVASQGSSDGREVIQVEVDESL